MVFCPGESCREPREPGETAGARGEIILRVTSPAASGSRAAGSDMSGGSRPPGNLVPGGTPWPSRDDDAPGHLAIMTPARREQPAPQPPTCSAAPPGGSARTAKASRKATRLARHGNEYHGTLAWGSRWQPSYSAGKPEALLGARGAITPEWDLASPSAATQAHD